MKNQVNMTSEIILKRHNLYKFLSILMITCLVTTCTSNKKTNGGSEKVGNHKNEKANTSQTFCDFSDILQNKNVNPIAKHIYLQRNVDSSILDQAYFLTEDLHSNDTHLEAFYCLVISRLEPKADGALAEGLSGACKKWVEEHTSSFFSYFDNKDCFTESELRNWASFVKNELELIGENEGIKEYKQIYTKTLERNCRHCSDVQKNTMRRFIKMLL